MATGVALIALGYFRFVRNEKLIVSDEPRQAEAYRPRSPSPSSLWRSLLSTSFRFWLDNRRR